MCLILAAVEKIHSVETRNTSLVELSKREALRREYNTGEVAGPSALTFPERAMKVTGHCSLQRDSRVVSASSPQTSRMLPQSSPSIAQRSSGWQGDSLSSTHPCFPQSCKGTSSDRLSLQVDTRRLLMPIQAGT